MVKTLSLENDDVIFHWARPSQEQGVYCKKFVHSCLGTDKKEIAKNCVWRIKTV